MRITIIPITVLKLYIISVLTSFKRFFFSRLKEIGRITKKRIRNYEGEIAHITVGTYETIRRVWCMFGGGGVVVLYIPSEPQRGGVECLRAVEYFGAFRVYSAIHIP